MALSVPRLPNAVAWTPRSPIFSAKSRERAKWAAALSYSCASARPPPIANRTLAMPAVSASASKRRRLSRQSGIATPTPRGPLASYPARSKLSAAPVARRSERVSDRKRATRRTGKESFHAAATASARRSAARSAESPAESVSAAWPSNQSDALRASIGRRRTASINTESGASRASARIESWYGRCTASATIGSTVRSGIMARSPHQTPRAPNRCRGQRRNNLQQLSSKTASAPFDDLHLVSNRPVSQRFGNGCHCATTQRTRCHVPKRVRTACRVERPIRQGRYRVGIEAVWTWDRRLPRVEMAPQAIEGLGRLGIAHVDRTMERSGRTKMLTDQLADLLARAASAWRRAPDTRDCKPPWRLANRPPSPPHRPAFLPRHTARRPRVRQD